MHLSKHWNNSLGQIPLILTVFHFFPPQSLKYSANLQTQPVAGCVKSHLMAPSFWTEKPEQSQVCDALQQFSFSEEH